MTTELLGHQEPRLFFVPEGDAARGDLAVEFCRWAGLTLLEWQEDLLRDMCRTKEDGTWSSREVVVPLARQNGKGEVLLARELVGIYLFGEQIQYHTAHLMDTAIDAQKRLWSVIEENPSLLYWWGEGADVEPTLVKSNGKESIDFPKGGRMPTPEGQVRNGPGAKIYFRTRTKKTGRGLSIDLLIFDECYDLPVEVYAAMNSTTKARPNAQKIFISSPVNRFEHMHGAIFSAKRWAGMDGTPGVLFKEWSIAEDADPFSPESWAMANPSLGPVLQFGELEADAISAKNSEDLLAVFKVESLGVGNWVPRDGAGDEDFAPIVELDAWARLLVSEPLVVGECAVAADVTPDGSRVGVAAALRTDRGVHVMLAPVSQFDRDHLVDGLVDVAVINDPVSVAVDPRGPASTLLRGLSRHSRASVEADEMRPSTVVAATELFLSMVADGRLTHDGDPRWVEALEVAEFREIRDTGRALSRRSGAICDLVAATFAVWALEEFETPADVDVVLPVEAVDPVSVPSREVALSVSGGGFGVDFDF